MAGRNAGQGCGPAQICGCSRTSLSLHLHEPPCPPLPAPSRAQGGAGGTELGPLGATPWGAGCLIPLWAQPEPAWPEQGRSARYINGLVLRPSMSPSPTPSTDITIPMATEALQKKRKKGR